MATRPALAAKCRGVSFDLVGEVREREREREREKERDTHRERSEHEKKAVVIETSRIFCLLFDKERAERKR
jgi:hypothetical protein